MAPSLVVPLMIEVQFYEEDKTEFRISVRAPPSENLSASLVNFLQLYMYPNNR